VADEEDAQEAIRRFGTRRGEVWIPDEIELVASFKDQDIRDEVAEQHSSADWIVPFAPKGPARASRPRSERQRPWTIRTSLSMPEPAPSGPRVDQMGAVLSLAPVEQKLKLVIGWILVLFAVLLFWNLDHNPANDPVGPCSIDFGRFKGCVQNPGK
jgi:hypothetical protein